MLGMSQAIGSLASNMRWALRVGIADWAEACIGIVVWRRVIAPVVCGEDEACELVAQLENLATLYVTGQLLHAVHPVAAGCLAGGVGLALVARTWDPNLKDSANKGLETTLDICRMVGIAALTLCYCDSFYRNWRPPQCWTPIVVVTLIGAFLTVKATSKKRLILQGVRG